MKLLEKWLDPYRSCLNRRRDVCWNLSSICRRNHWKGYHRLQVVSEGLGRVLSMLLSVHMAETEHSDCFALISSYLL